MAKDTPWREDESLGARALAEQGKSPEEIVKYWFKDVELKNCGNNTPECP